MKTQITTFIFDCFGVISDPVLNGWYRDNRLSKGLVDENLKYVFEKFDLGHYSEDDILDYFSKYDGIASTKEELRKEIDNYLKIDNSLVETIELLKDRGYKTALLSNANAAFFLRKVYPTYPQFKNLFDEIIISSEVGMVKPHEDIYHYTLKKIDSQPQEALFIDDSKTNVDAAVALGMNGYVYTNSQGFLKYLKSVGVSLSR